MAQSFATADEGTISKPALPSFPLVTFPERTHAPSKPDCDQFNAKLMKHIMRKKMGRN
jgi:hypothetical protein